MKLSMFTNKADRAAWAKREAELIRANGLASALREYADALAGKGKAEWLALNAIPADCSEKYWEEHIDYIKWHVNFLEKEVRKLDRIAADI